MTLNCLHITPLRMHLYYIYYIYYLLYYIYFIKNQKIKKIITFFDENNNELILC